MPGDSTNQNISEHEMSFFIGKHTGSLQFRGCTLQHIYIHGGPRLRVADLTAVKIKLLP